MKNESGMAAVRIALKEAKKTITWLASEINISRGAISQWDKIPAERIGEVSRLTGLSHETLRPDLFAAAAPA